MGSYVWNYADDLREKKAIALETARSFLSHIVAVRSWNAEHGGVFVYTTEKTPVNPFLPSDQQFVVTDEGRMLTLVNPAYMTRQIAEISDRQTKVRFHLTSLDPIRLENKALPWEEGWLKEFEQGAQERSAFVKEPEGGESFHYMAPLRVTGSCIPCHEGYTSGDVRGGISVSLPGSFHKAFSLPLLLSHLAAAIMGILGIHFFASRLEVRSKQLLVSNQCLQKEVEERKQSEKELVKVKEELEQRVTSRTAELTRTNVLLDAKIREQQQVETALVEINDEFIQIFNSAPDGMHIIDREFKVIRANRAFMDLTGYSEESIAGRKCFDVFRGRLCHTPDCPLTRILAGEARVEVEARKMRADGSLFPCVVTATPFRAPSGKIIGIIEVFRDITSWKDAEKALSLAAQDLLQRNQELQDFSHVISHDLQEPLMLVQAFSQRLQAHCGAELTEKGLAYLDRIIGSAERMQMLIDGLLYYSRIEKEARPFVPVHLNEIVQTVLEDLTIKMEDSHALIKVDELGTVLADPLQIRQLLQNIIGNSLKYHHSDRTPEIWISPSQVPQGFDPEEYLSLSIRDNGIGFKEEYQEKIFEIFQRLHTRQQFKGSGIGLSICKKIVERHHGMISASAVPGEGAEFVITLPLYKENSSSS